MGNFGLDDFDFNENKNENKSENENNFDSFGGFGGFGDSEESGDFGDNNVNDNGDKKDVVKTAIITIIIGIIIIIGLLVIMQVVNNKGDNKHTIENDIDKKSGLIANNLNKNNVDGYNKDSWIRFKSSKGDIKFTEGYIDCMFTVTDVQDYMMVVDNDNNIAIKTIVWGNISGFKGTYQIEIPYKFNNQLLVGKDFEVKVKIGSYADKKVIGEIKY